MLIFANLLYFLRYSFFFNIKNWVCGFALAYNFIIKDLFTWELQPEAAPPDLQMEHLTTVLLGMLGLGGLRTYEKLNDKTK